MTPVAVLAVLVVIAFVSVAVWIMRDPHFVDPPPRPRRISRLRRRQVRDICEHDRVDP